MRKPPASETGAVDARDMRKPPASETGAVDTCDMRKPPASETGAVDARDIRKLPASETGAVDARDMRKPPASETGAVDARDMPASETGAADARDMPSSETGAADTHDTRQPPRARPHVNSPAFQVRHNCPFFRTPDPNKRRQCVSRTNPLFRSCSRLGVRPTYFVAAWKHVDMNMLSTLGPNKRAHEHPSS